MTEPVSEQLLAKVQTRVAAALTSYRSTRVATWIPEDEACSVYFGGLTPNPEISCPGNPPAQGWTLSASVAGICKPSDKDTTPIDTYKQRIAADIIKAVTNASTWHNWDGLAVNTELGEVSDVTGNDGSWQGIAVQLSVHFRTDEDDPYQVRT